MNADSDKDIVIDIKDDDMFQLKRGYGIFYLEFDTNIYGDDTSDAMFCVNDGLERQVKWQSKWKMRKLLRMNGFVLNNPFKPDDNDMFFKDYLLRSV